MEQLQLSEKDQSIKDSLQLYISVELNRQLNIRKSLLSKKELDYLIKHSFLLNHITINDDYILFQHNKIKIKLKGLTSYLWQMTLRDIFEQINFEQSFNTFMTYQISQQLAKNLFHQDAYSRGKWNRFKQKLKEN